METPQLVLGLLIGAVFLVVLFISDSKEAGLEAQKKAQQEQAARAGRDYASEQEAAYAERRLIFLGRRYRSNRFHFGYKRPIKTS